MPLTRPRLALLAPLALVLACDAPTDDDEHDAAVEPIDAQHPIATRAPWSAAVASPCPQGRVVVAGGFTVIVPSLCRAEELDRGDPPPDTPWLEAPHDRLASPEAAR